MGLDITAYRQLALDPEATGEDMGDTHARIYANPHFPGRAVPLADGWYTYADSMSFRAGSYGGYGQWRQALATLAGYGNAEDCWGEDGDTGPFSELINFSDCEGAIGPVVSAKLAKDFAEFDGAAAKVMADPWFYERYAHWRKAFEMAADGGAVEFG
jgi:hypothetical protein